MKQQFAAVFAILFGLVAFAPAHARDWDSATGATYDVYMVRTVETSSDRFGMIAMFFEQSEETSLNDLVDIADSLFEESAVNYALDRGLTSAIVRFSPPGEELEEGELPSVLADVRYETYGDNQWERVNYLEVPVGESPLFPSAPTSAVTLSDGTVVGLEPITQTFPGDAERAGLNVRVVYPYLVLEGPVAPQALELIWDEIIRPVATTQGANQVAVSIYNEPSERRFHMRPAYGGVFTKLAWESWPTYGAMSEGSQ